MAVDLRGAKGDPGVPGAKGDPGSAGTDLSILTQSGENIGVAFSPVDDQYRLIVHGDSDTSALQLQNDPGANATTFKRIMGFTNTANTNQFASFDLSSDSFRLITNQKRMVFQSTSGFSFSAGNVGIGTSEPASALDVNGVIQASPSASQNGFSGFTWGPPTTPLISIGWPGSITSTNYIKSSEGDNKSLQIGSASTGSSRLRFETGGATRMMIESDGTVGIGTTNPAATLDVNGFMRLTPNASAPTVCNAATAGALALKTNFSICVCNGSSWIHPHDASSCGW